MAVKRHGTPTVAVLVSTLPSVCLERQGPPPADRRVPEDAATARTASASASPS